MGEQISSIRRDIMKILPNYAYNIKTDKIWIKAHASLSLSVNNLKTKQVFVKYEEILYLEACSIHLLRKLFDAGIGSV